MGCDRLGAQATQAPAGIDAETWARRVEGRPAGITAQEYQAIACELQEAPAPSTRSSRELTPDVPADEPLDGLAIFAALGGFDGEVRKLSDEFERRCAKAGIELSTEQRRGLRKRIANRLASEMRKRARADRSHAPRNRAPDSTLETRPVCAASARQRQPRAAATRVRGSRRAATRKGGGARSGPDDGPSAHGFPAHERKRRSRR